MAITKIWAANGIKSPIPATPQGDNLVNYDEGFTTPYRTPIKDGGVPIGMGTFNQLMFDITDEIIQNKSTLNQVAQQISSIIDDTQTNLTSTWSSQLIDNKLSAAVAAIIDDNQTTSTLTWSSLKIQAEIGQASTGGGNANIDDDTISTDKVWSSFKTNEMVKGGRTISISNLETQEGSEDTTIANTTANAKMVNLSVKVKTNATTNKYLGDVVVYYNDPSKEILRQSCVSQNIADATELTTAMGMTILDAQDSLIIQSQPASGVIDFWNNVTLIKSTSNVTGSAPVPEPLGEGLLFTAQASSSSVTFNKQGTPTELQLEYQTTLGDVTSGWQDYTLGTRVDLSPNDKVSFRNKGTQTITQTDTNYHYFTMTGEIKAENDLTYLFDGVGGVDTIAEYGCYKMFSGCAALTQMPDLSATNIGANGYANMFEGCTKLKTIKPLNATTLANYSYKEMFKNCSKLLITETEGETSFLTMPATAPINAGDNMFVGTGGTFVGTPTANSSYFYNKEISSAEGLTFTNIDTGAITLQFVTAVEGQSPVTLNLECKITGGDWADYDPYNNVKTLQPNETIIIRNKGLQNDLTFTNQNYIKLQTSGKVRIGGSLNFLFSNLGAQAEVKLGAYGLYYFCSNNKNVYGTLEKVNFVGVGTNALSYAFSGSNINEVKGAKLDATLNTATDPMFNSIYNSSAITKLSGDFEFINYPYSGSTGWVSFERSFYYCGSLEDASNATVTITVNRNGTYGFLFPCDFTNATSLKKAPKFIKIETSLSGISTNGGSVFSFYNCSSLEIPPIYIKASRRVRISDSVVLQTSYFRSTFTNCSSMRVAPLIENLDNFVRTNSSVATRNSEYYAFTGTFYGCSNLKISKNSGDVLFLDYNGAHGAYDNSGEYATFGNTGGTFTGSVQTQKEVATQAKFYYQIPSDLTNDEKEFLRNQRDYMIGTGDAKYNSSIQNINAALEAQK